MQKHGFSIAIKMEAVLFDSYYCGNLLYKKLLTFFLLNPEISTIPVPLVTSIYLDFVRPRSQLRLLLRTSMNPTPDNGTVLKSRLSGIIRMSGARRVKRYDKIHFLQYKYSQILVRCSCQHFKLRFSAHIAF